MLVHIYIATCSYICFYTIVDITIVKNPQDVTVCINTTAKINCGNTGADPNLTVPNWRIISRNDDGSVINNVTYDGLVDITKGLISGLQWSPDLTSGDNNASNSKLLVGPVNKTHNQSSYQCIFDTGLIYRISKVGTLTVVGMATYYKFKNTKT